MNNTLLAIDIASSNVRAVIAKHDSENNIVIQGVGLQKSEGINKGLIINIEEASRAIKEAVDNARKSSMDVIDNCVVSISGTYSKSIRSNGSVNVPNGLIAETDINQVMQMALYNATIVPEYEVIHVIPIYFKVDDSVEVDNPLNMNGSRLEVSVYIVTAKRTALTNIKSALKLSGLDNPKFVLDGYATAIAVLEEQQKKFGATVINLGSTTTEFVCYKGNSLIFNSFIPVGSDHITNDLSAMLTTPLLAAEKIKIEYGSLTKDYSQSTSDLDSVANITKVKIPRIGDEDTSTEVALADVQTIIHARVEEVLILVRNKLKKSGVLDNPGLGIVLTGGMSNLSGIKKLASKVFEGINITLSSPKNIKNPFTSFDEPTMSTVVGLLQYALGTNRSYQLDSSKKLVKPIKKEVISHAEVPSMIPEIKKDAEIIASPSNPDALTPLPKEKGKVFEKFLKKIQEMF